MVASVGIPFVVYLVVLVLAVVVVAGLLGWVYVNTKPDPDKRPKKPAQDEGPSTTPTSRPGGRRAAMQDLRRRKKNRKVIEDEKDASEDGLPKKKLGAKKLRKLEQKELKRQQREAMEAEREAKREREAQEEAELEELREQRKEEERKRREEEARLEKEREERELKEFDQWKDLISVEGGGTGTEEEELRKKRLDEEAIPYLKSQKVVMVEELANLYDIKTQDIIEKLEELNEAGDVVFLIDDRGKIVYITDEELNSVAEYIKFQGRVSLSELSAESNKLIEMPSN